MKQTFLKRFIGNFNINWIVLSGLDDWSVGDWSDNQDWADNQDWSQGDWSDNDDWSVSL